MTRMINIDTVTKTEEIINHLKNGGNVHCTKMIEDTPGVFYLEDASSCDKGSMMMTLEDMQEWSPANHCLSKFPSHSWLSMKLEDQGLYLDLDYEDIWEVYVISE